MFSRVLSTNVGNTTRSHYTHYDSLLTDWAQLSNNESFLKIFQPVPNKSSKISLNENVKMWSQGIDEMIAYMTEIKSFYSLSHC